MNIDEKIDRLAEIVQRGFEGVDKKIDGVRDELSELRVDMEKGFDEVNRRIDKGIQPQLDGHAHSQRN